MKRFVSLLMCILMLTSISNFSSIVNAVTSIELSSIETEEKTEEAFVTYDTNFEETTDTCVSEEVTEESMENDLIDKTITGFYNGYTVEASGMLPQVATLSLTSVDDDSAQKLVAEMRTDGTTVFACDIKILDVNGKEWQPNETVNVKVSGIKKTSKDVQFLHVSDDIDTVLAKGNATDCVETITDVTKGENGEVVFPTDGFSTFIGFTVDFHYNGETFSMGGKETVKLSEIFNQLNINGDVAFVENVTFTDPTLVEITKDGDDWNITSLEPFQTDERLTVTFKDGEVLEIAVTDYTVRSVTIGNATKFTDDESGNTYTTRTGAGNLKITVSSADNDPDTIDGYAFSGEIESGFHLIINLAGNIRYTGSRIIVEDGGKLTFNNARSSGDAYVFSGDLSTSSSSSGNTVMVYEGGAFAITGSEGKRIVFDGHKASNLASVDKVLATATTARKSRVLSFASNGSYSETNSIVDIDHAVFQNYSSTSTYDDQGGAIRFNCAKKSVSITNSEFINISTSTTGSAIYFEAIEGFGKINIGKDPDDTSDDNDPVSNKFYNCTATSYGGAIRIMNSCTDLSVCGNYFEDCKTTAESGGVISISADTNVTNTFRVNENRFINASAKKYGGAIATNATVGTSENSLAEVMEMNNNAFKNCSVSAAESRGGAVYFGSNARIYAPKFLMEYNDDFSKYNANDTYFGTSTKVGYTAAFDNCRTIETYTSTSPTAAQRKDNIPAGGGICFDMEQPKIKKFTLHIEPGVFDTLNVFQNCKSYVGGAIAAHYSVGNNSTSVSNLFNRYEFDYGTTLYDENGRVVTKDGEELDGNAHDEILPDRTGATFKDCKSTFRSGAISIDSSTDGIIMDGMIFDGCVSSEGSAFMLTTGNSYNTLKVTDSIFRNCDTVHLVVSSTYGGTICSASEVGCVFTVENSTFKNNESFWSGGAIYWSAHCDYYTPGTSMTIKGCMIDGNRAGYSGGGIYNESVMSVYNTVIKNNSALTQGGGVHIIPLVDSSEQAWQPSVIALTLGAGCELSNNTAGLFGGGVAVQLRYSGNVHYNLSGARIEDVTMDFTMNDVFTAQDVTDGYEVGDNIPTELEPKVENNVAGINGGGVYLGMGWSTSLANGWDSYIADDNGTTISEVTDYAGTTNTTYQQRLVNAINKNINIKSGSVSDNVAGYDGGGIYANGNNTIVNVTDGTFANNTAGVSNQIISVLNDTKTDGTSVFDLINYSDTYRKSKISQANDDGTYFADRKLRLDDSVTGYGGAICLKGNNSVCNITGGSIGIANAEVTDADSAEESAIYKYGNKADFGGAIAVKEGTVNISSTDSEGSICYNYAKGGGAIYTIGDGTVNIKDSDIAYNHAEVSGDLTANEKSTSTAQTIPEVSSGGIDEIESERDASYVDKLTLGSGGAIYVNAGALALSGSSVNNNIATNGAGGGIYADNGGDVNMNGGLIYSNKAELTEATDATTAYHGAELRGVGGAVAIGSGVNGNTTTFTINQKANAKLTIYNNSADFAANDIYSSGQHTDLEIYNFTQMNDPEITDNLFTVALFEDYHSGDTSYLSLTDNIGRANSVDNILRYYDGKLKYRVNDVKMGATVNSINKQSVNDANTYVCLTVAKMTDYILGDVDGNGMINILDVSMIQLSLIRKIQLDDIQKYLGDVNGSGNITILDISIIQLRLIRKDVSSVKNADGFTIGEVITFGNGQLVVPEPTEATEEPSSTESQATEPSEPATEESESSSATEPTEETEPTTSTEKSTSPDSGAKPSVTIQADSVLAYTLKNLAVNLAIQNFCITDEYVYITQRYLKDTYISRLKKNDEEKVATFMDNMIIIDGGHGQALDVYNYNGQEYLYVATNIENYSTNHFSTEVARLIYEPGETKHYSDLNRCVDMNYANTTGKSLGTTYRVAVGGNDDYTICRVQTRESTITYSIYDTVAINKLLDESLTVSMNSDKARSACIKYFTQSGSTIVRPNNSFQGVDMIGMDKIYITGGGAGDTPMMACMSNTGAYKKLIKFSSLGTPEIEGVQCLNDRLYFIVLPSGTCKKNTQQVRYIPQSFGD